LAGKAKAWFMPFVDKRVGVQVKLASEVVFRLRCAVTSVHIFNTYTLIILRSSEVQTFRSAWLYETFKHHTDSHCVAARSGVVFCD